MSQRWVKLQMSSGDVIVDEAGGANESSGQCETAKPRLSRLSVQRRAHPNLAQLKGDAGRGETHTH